ncbi:tail fiber protein [Sulfitobacter sp. HNIBRBA2951]|uniref:phage tail protein n=1 Tax=Sulfitobacter aquimarinus TaxID=3158557 RepID=UPI0032DEB8C9
MSEPFIGEIRMVGFNFAPRGWASCSGQLIAIPQNQALFSLLGTSYGGDGTSTFGLPDLRGRTPVHQGPAVAGRSARSMGQSGGQETVTLTENQIASHAHDATMLAESRPGNSATPAGNIIAAGSNIFRANSPAEDQVMDPNSVQVSSAGGNQPHDNMAPFQVVNFVIAMFGMFPPRS